MATSRSSVFWQALGLGVVAGMRSMSSVALLSHALKNSPSGRLANSPLHWLQSKGVATALKLMAGAEMVGDKMPNAPDRTKAVSVTGRALSGALVGGVLYKLNRGKLLTGASVGALGAVAGTYGAFFLRKLTSQRTGLKEPWAGLAEDALTLASGAALLRGHMPGH